MDILKYKAIEKMARNTTLKPNGWNEWAKYVLLTLEEQSSEIKKLDDKLDKMQVEVAEVKTKVAIRATILGAVAGVGLSILSYFLIELIKTAA